MEISPQPETQAINPSNSLLTIQNKPNITSNILKNIDHTFLIEILFSNQKIKSAELLYCSEQHEKSPKTFHEKCDGVANTLILIETTENRRFGGFTSIPWSSKEGWVEGNGTDFIFSLCKKTKFLNNDRKDCAIYNHSNCFPCFGGGCDIGLLGNCFVNDQSAHAFFPFSYGVGAELDIRGHFYFAGNDEFQVLRLEVFRIDFH